VAYIEEYAIFAPIVILLMAVSTFLLNLSRDLFETEEKSTTALGGGPRIVSYKYASTEAQNLRDLISIFSKTIFSVVKMLIVVIAMSLICIALRSSQWPCTRASGALCSTLKIYGYLNWFIFSKQVLFMWLATITPFLVWWLARLVTGIINERARYPHTLRA
jgi:hypothetical protein